MNYTALVMAAGKNAAKGISYKKALAEMKEGQSVLDKAISVFLEDDRCKQIVVVTNSADLQRLVQSHESRKIMHVKGGVTRVDSVFNGLMAVLEDTVLIHDGVRPWVQRSSIDTILEKMQTEQACVLAIKPKGTLLNASDGYVESVVPHNYKITQTPQGYKTDFVLKCYTAAKRLELDVLDDAELVARVSDTPIAVVEGDIRNVRFILKD